VAQQAEKKHEIIEKFKTHDTDTGSSEVQIALLPLLTGDVVVRRVLLEEADVLLEVNAKGEKNWVFTPAKPSSRPRCGSTSAGRTAATRWWRSVVRPARPSC